MSSPPASDPAGSLPGFSHSAIEPCDRRAAAVVGRHARLELAFARRGGRTVLAAAYAEPPFRVGRCFPDGDGVHFILASSAPGVFGGDCLRQTIRVACGARVRLTSQSALQAHPTSDQAVARLVSSYEVDDDAELRCQWDPLIPFADARIDQQIEIRLAGRACLYWSDALMSGRQARGERWAFTSLAHELRVLRAGSLEYLERYRIEPAGHSPGRSWVAGDASYLGTALASGWEVEAGLADRLHKELGAIAGVRAAADRLDPRVLLVRLMSGYGPAFHEARRRIRDQGPGIRDQGAGIRDKADP